MRLFLYSNGEKFGWFSSGKELQREHGMGKTRPYKIKFDDEDLKECPIPPKWERCPEDKTAIQPKTETVRKFFRELNSINHVHETHQKLMTQARGK